MTLRSCPSIRIFPVVGRSTPPSRLSSVVLPQPLGPMMATASPFFTSHVLSRSACTSSAAIVYFLLTLSTRTSTPLCSNIFLLSRGAQTFFNWRRGPTPAASYRLCLASDSHVLGSAWPPALFHLRPGPTGTPTRLPRW